MPTTAVLISDSHTLSEILAGLRDLAVEIVLQGSSIGDWRPFLEQLSKTHPDILLIELSCIPRPLEHSLERISSLPHPPAIVAIHRSAEPETILEILRAGASEFLYPPFQVNLRKCLERIIRDRAKMRNAAAHPEGRSIGLLSAKGGCGATTVACHLAAELQRQTDRRILLADFDLDGGMIGFLMKASSPYSLMDAAANTHRLDASFWKALISNGTPNLEVISVPDSAPGTAAIPPERLQHVLRFVRTLYDWILVDLGHSLNPVADCAFQVLDSIVLITTPDVPGFFQAKRVIKSLNERYRAHDPERDANRIRLVLNRAPRQADFSMEEVERMLGVSVFETLPCDDASLYESYAEGRLLPEASCLRNSIGRLASRLAGIPEPKQQRRFRWFG